MAEIPEDLRYTDAHEWIRSGNDLLARVGITAYAAEQLGDIVFVRLPEVGEELSSGDACGDLESTKSFSDIFAPASGVVVRVNEELADNPAAINQDPYGDGWLFELEVASESDLDDLLDAQAYGALVA